MMLMMLMMMMVVVLVVVVAVKKSVGERPCAKDEIMTNGRVWWP